MGKQLSDGWSCNFAVGCTHACPFCYGDAIYKRFGKVRHGNAVLRRWGDYLLIPENLDEAIQETRWSKWQGAEVMLSPTHDPYLPTLARFARKILERGLSEGVRFCIQTRSYLVTKDFDLLREYAEQVRLQVSASTSDREFARLIEPGVPPPEARLEILKRARQAGLSTGVILAPVFPPLAARPDPEADLRTLAGWLERIRPDHVYGEAHHVRGANLRLVELAVGEPIHLPRGFDNWASERFHRELRQVGLEGVWWPE